MGLFGDVSFPIFTDVFEDAKLLLPEELGYQKSFEVFVFPFIDPPPGSNVPPEVPAGVLEEAVPEDDVLPLEVPLPLDVLL